MVIGAIGVIKRDNWERAFPEVRLYSAGRIRAQPFGCIIFEIQLSTIQPCSNIAILQACRASAVYLR